MLVQQDVVIDPALTNVSIKYTNSNYIADKIFPMYKSVKQTGKYFIYDKSNLRADLTERAAGSPAAEIDYGVSKSAVFYCSDHALKGFVEDEVQDQAEAALNPLVDEVEIITEKLLVDREINLANLITNTSNVTQNVTLSGTEQWSDYNNSDPIGDIRLARITIHQNTFQKPNTLILSKPVFDYLAEHPEIIDRVKYSQLGTLTEELMARLFHLDQVIVGEAGYNSAKEGQADSLSYIWGNNAIVCFINPVIRLKMLTFGLTMTYSVRQAKRWRDEDREGTYVRIGNDNYIQLIIAANAGYLIVNPVVSI